MPHFKLEAAHENLHVCGVDEAGRGPWAGPVVAAAAIFKVRTRIQALNDSKLLSAQQREGLLPKIHTRAVVGIGIASVEEIDEHNIWGATSLAMLRAVQALPFTPHIALIDGNLHPANFPCKTQTVIGGDGISQSIAAASVVAKVTRDRMMAELAQLYPHYGFERHAGYGTPEHQHALRVHGVSPIHRRSWAPIRALLEAA